MGWQIKQYTFNCHYVTEKTVEIRVYFKLNDKEESAEYSF